MYDGELLKESFNTIKIRQLESQIAALKAELAQQTNNKQSTPCHWCDGVRPMLNHAYCSNCGRKL